MKAPGFGDRRKAMLEDIAVVTGAQVIAEDLGLKLESAKIELLGRADRVVVRLDSEGFQITTATGAPARFRQKREAHDEWIEGEALQIEIDDKREMIELHQRARMLRDQDEMRGDLISLDTRSEFFSVSGAKGPGAASGPEGRVRAVLQPKAQDAGAAKSAPGAKR